MCVCLSVCLYACFTYYSMCACEYVQYCIYTVYRHCIVYYGVLLYNIVLLLLFIICKCTYVCIPINCLLCRAVYSSGDVEIKVEPEQSPLRRKVGQMTTEIIHGMDVDALLLAALVSERLLTENQRQTLHSKLECSKPQIDINSYFLNVILLNWPFALFDGNLSKLSVILADHDSPGNQHLGETLHKLMEDDKE